MKHQYPKDAVDALFRSSSPETCESLFPIKTPRHLVYQMAEIAYHASFLAEEGRPTRFQIGLLQRDRVFAGPGRVLDEMTVLEFSERKTLSTKELLRLAPATDYTTTLICVDAAMLVPGCANQGLQIWGLVSPGSSTNKLKRLQSPTAVHVPTCLIVSSNAPGHVQLSQNIRPLVTLRSGKVSVTPREPPGLPPKIAELLSERALVFEADHETARGKSQLYGNWLHDRVQQKYLEVFCRLLMQLAETHHGLTLLFIASSAQESLTSLVSVKYKTRCGRVESLLRAYFRAIQSIPPSDKYEVSADRIEDLLTDALSAIADASSVDGALIVNDRFDVVGFGAEILAGAAVQNLYFSTRKVEGKYSCRPVTEYGTRHRSAARFTLALPGTITFVVSQDGERKLMTCVEEKVVVWPSIQWEQIWETLVEPLEPPSE